MSLFLPTTLNVRYVGFNTASGVSLTAQYAKITVLVVSYS